jgi:hypothetical protein
MALVAVPLVAAGCGGGGTDATQGMTAEQVLTKAAANTEALTSYRFGIDLKATAKVDGGGALGDILRNPIDISGEGAAKKPGDFTLDVTANIGPGPIQANITKVGGELYASVLGQAVKIDLPAQAVKSLDATRLAPAIADWIENPEIVGSEDIDGVPVVHIRGTADEKALAEGIGGLAGGLGADDLVQPGATGAGSDLETGVIDVWVDQEQMIIRRASADVLSEDALAAAPSVKALDLDLTASLSDFNAPVEVTAPTGARTVSLDQITGLLGG